MLRDERDGSGCWEEAGPHQRREPGEKCAKPNRTPAPTGDGTIFGSSCILGLSLTLPDTAQQAAQ